MKQTYSPNLSVKAIRGYCLKYIDDAGDAPSRTPTAKAAYEVEKKAGRIRTGDTPLNVWVVFWLDFTVGQYTKEGHVFFVKNLGNDKYELRDSEVGAGARKPYGSLKEIVAWFGAYKPKPLGWSTNCDGRQYANEEKNMDGDDVKWVYRIGLGREPENDQVWRPAVGEKFSKFAEGLSKSDEWKSRQNMVNDYASLNDRYIRSQNRIKELEAKLADGDKQPSRPADIDVVINGEKYLKKGN